VALAFRSHNWPDRRLVADGEVSFIYSGSSKATKTKTPAKNHNKQSS
jgi:hypothetical protein